MHVTQSLIQSLCLYNNLCSHLSLDQEHLDRSEQILQEEVQRRAADFISRKEALQEELTSVQVVALIWLVLERGVNYVMVSVSE